MGDKVLPALSRAFFDSDLIGSRITLAVAEFLWAIMLAWPGDTFGRPTYTVMSHIFNEEAWAFLFFLTAVLQLSIVLMETFHTTFARYFAGFNAVLWVTVVVGMLLSVYPPPAAIAGEIALALTATWIWARPFILLEGIKRARKL